MPHRETLCERIDQLRARLPGIRRVWNANALLAGDGALTDRCTTVRNTIDRDAFGINRQRGRDGSGAARATGSGVIPGLACPDADRGPRDPILRLRERRRQCGSAAGSVLKSVTRARCVMDRGDKPRDDSRVICGTQIASADAVGQPQKAEGPVRHRSKPPPIIPGLRRGRL